MLRVKYSLQIIMSIITYHWGMGTPGVEWSVDHAREPQRSQCRASTSSLLWLWKAVILNSHCRTSYRKRYAVCPTAFV